MVSRESTMATDRLQDACDRNHVGAFRALVPHAGSSVGGTRMFGGVTAVATGVPEAFWNPVMVLSPDVADDDVLEAIDWIGSLGLPISLQVRGDISDRIQPLAAVFGLVPEAWASPSMALSPILDIPPPPRGLRIEPARSDTFEDWHAGQPWGERFRRTFGDGLVDDPAFRLVTGYVDDEPVAAAAAILTGDVVGIYAVGTHDGFRRRGFGSAMTWAAIRAGVDTGCRVAVLQSSEMGLGVYRSMGFIQVCTYVLFEPALDVGHG
jgi:GNAT superfamily N-acetyltransferase